MPRPRVFPAGVVSVVVHDRPKKHVSQRRRIHPQKANAANHKVRWSSSFDDDQCSPGSETTPKRVVVPRVPILIDIP